MAGWLSRGDLTQEYVSGEMDRLFCRFYARLVFKFLKQANYLKLIVIMPLCEAVVISVNED
ncbi:hypothetical protein ACQU0X_20150 [Pseudovibrio ascidiaceicola]|uniref:hypothetical protein n=1 Tax=Pseudovibrio ascidiaceicola TaxID=285279 RepID=UPI003D36C158